MQALILIGLKRLDGAKTEVENLYTGLDGVELAKAADKAAESKAYSRIEKLVNPMGTPMPIDPTPTKGSGKPKEPERKAAKAPQSAKAPKHIQDREDDLKKIRAGRFKPTEFNRASPRTDGPTINEFVAQGGDPEKYPPAGFSAKPEPFNRDKVAVLAAQYLKAKQDDEAKKKGPPAKPSGPPPKQNAPETAGQTTSTEAPETPAAEVQQQQTATTTEGSQNESTQGAESAQ